MVKQKRKPVKIVAIIAAVTVVALGAWFVTRSKKSTPKVASNQSVSTADAEKANKLSKPTDTKNASGDSTPSAETSVNNLAVIINRPVDGDTIPLSEGIDMRVSISGSNSKTGTCTLAATGPNGQRVTKSAPFEPQTSYSSCTIMIPSNQLAAGTWTTSLTVTSGGATSKAISQKVTLQ